MRRQNLHTVHGAYCGTNSIVDFGGDKNQLLFVHELWLQSQPTFYCQNFQEYLFQLLEVMACSSPINTNFKSLISFSTTSTLFTIQMLTMGLKRHSGNNCYIP